MGQEYVGLTPNEAIKYMARAKRELFMTGSGDAFLAELTKAVLANIDRFTFDTQGHIVDVLRSVVDYYMNNRMYERAASEIVSMIRAHHGWVPACHKGGEHIDRLAESGADMLNINGGSRWECSVCGQRGSVLLDGFEIQLRSNPKFDSEVLHDVCPGNVVSTYEIEFPSGKILMNDWLRAITDDIELPEDMKYNNKYSIATQRGCKNIGEYYLSKGLIHSHNTQRVLCDVVDGSEIRINEQAYDDNDGQLHPGAPFCAAGSYRAFVMMDLDVYNGYIRKRYPEMTDEIRRQIVEDVAHVVTVDPGTYRITTVDFSSYPTIDKIGHFIKITKK